MKKSFLVLSLLGIFLSSFNARLHSQLIEPTRRLDQESEAAAFVTVLSEPPGMQACLAGQPLGKTPIFAARFPAGAWMLRVQDSETRIFLMPGKTTAISWFKGSFIQIPEKSEPSPKTASHPPQPAPKPETHEKQDGPQSIQSNPYYWPLNPRGPIQ